RHSCVGSPLLGGEEGDHVEAAVMQRIHVGARIASKTLHGVAAKVEPHDPYAVHLRRRALRVVGSEHGDTVAHARHAFTELPYHLGHAAHGRCIALHAVRYVQRAIHVDGRMSLGRGSPASHTRGAITTLSGRGSSQAPHQLKLLLAMMWWRAWRISQRSQ